MFCAWWGSRSHSFDLVLSPSRLSVFSFGATTCFETPNTANLNFPTQSRMLNQPIMWCRLTTPVTTQLSTVVLLLMPLKRGPSSDTDGSPFFFPRLDSKRYLPILYPQDEGCEYLSLEWWSSKYLLMDTVTFVAGRRVVVGLGWLGTCLLLTLPPCPLPCPWPCLLLHHLLTVEERGDGGKYEEVFCLPEC